MGRPFLVAGTAGSEELVVVNRHPLVVVTAASAPGEKYDRSKEELIRIATERIHRSTAKATFHSPGGSISVESVPNRGNGRSVSMIFSSAPQWHVHVFA